jgi:signal transduction histidine kinase
MRELVRISPDEAFQTGRQLKHFSDSLNSDLGRAHYYRLMGALSYLNENFLYASAFIYQADKLYGTLGDSIGIANCYTTLANSYSRQKLYAQAVQYQKRAFSIFKKQNIKRRMGVVKSNLTFLYNNLGYYDSAMQSGTDALTINEDPKNYAALINDWKNRGVTLFYLKKYPEAIKSFEKSFSLNDLFKGQGNVEAVIETHLGLGRTFRVLGDRSNALLHFNEASRIGMKSGYLTWLKICLLETSRQYETDGNYREAHRLLQSFANVVDSLDQKQRVERSELGDVYLNALQESQQNDLLKQEKKLQKQVIGLQRLGIIYSAVAIVSLLVMLYFLKRANTRRKKINFLLNDRIAEVARQKIELEKLNQTKDKFFSIVAHDLRSPMNTLKSFASLIHQHADSMSKDEIVDLGGQIEMSTETTIKMLDNLITWARLQMQLQETNPEVFVIDELVEASLSVYRRAAEVKKITFENRVLERFELFADKNQVMFIIRNLINNAIKFTNANGQIRITTRKTDDGLLLSVYDNGVGIAVDKLQNIFHLKDQASTQGTAGEKGTGLGLVLCYEFAQQNNGKIWAESQPNQGTVFHLRLPSNVILK